VIEKIIDDPGEFREELLKIAIASKQNSRSLVWRGHQRGNYKLQPCLFRPELWEAISNSTASISAEVRHMLSNEDGFDAARTKARLNQAEFFLVREFYRLADRCGLLLPHISNKSHKLLNTGIVDFHLQSDDQGHWPPTDLLPIYALAQHHGVPTRLLDWTHDLHVALYFAVGDGDAQDDKYLSIFGFFADILDKYSPYTRKNLNPAIGRPLSNFITFVKCPTSTNPNLYAQSGCFTANITDGLYSASAQGTDVETLFASMHQEVRASITADGPTTIDGDLNNILFCLKTPRSNAPVLKEYLESINYVRTRLMPGYQSCADRVFREG
jgi:FRG domain